MKVAHNPNTRNKGNRKRVAITLHVRKHRAMQCYVLCSVNEQKASLTGTCKTVANSATSWPQHKKTHSSARLRRVDLTIWRLKLRVIGAKFVMEVWYTSIKIWYARTSTQCHNPLSLPTQWRHIRRKEVLTNSVALVRERTIPTDRPPPVGEVSANFCG